ncbi:hypothetical protein Salat_0201100 [Sesamum alatum]|uniref:DUF4283 domain-containing protein n=1 Tax=Sesamum alatum TaxID=300844 RepID=A0AAE2CXV7_9LAMI|nr:hypothetical protein Salat_0201100 [Sesamum alatum]
MDGSLLELGSALSLTEEEDEGVLLPNDPSGLHGLFELTLVGRLLSHRPANFEALSRTLVNLLQPTRGVEIRRITDSRFYFVFHHIVDLRRTLALRPWTFDRNLLILRELAPGDLLESVSLNWSPFYVRVHGIPYGLRTTATARLLGTKIGAWEDEANIEDSITWQDSLHMRILNDVTQPLKRALRVRLRHDASVVFTDGFIDPGVHAPYGLWLRENSFGSHSSVDYSSLRLTVVRPFRDLSSPVFSSSDNSGSSRSVRGAQVFRDFRTPLAGLPQQPSPSAEAGATQGPDLFSIAGLVQCPNQSAATGPPLVLSPSIATCLVAAPGPSAKIGPVSNCGPSSTVSPTRTPVGPVSNTVALRNLVSTFQQPVVLITSPPPAAQCDLRRTRRAGRYCPGALNLVDVPLAEAHVAEVGFSAVPPSLAGSGSRAIGGRRGRRRGICPGAKRKLSLLMGSSGADRPTKKRLDGFLFSEVWQASHTFDDHSAPLQRLQECLRGIQSWNKLSLAAMDKRIKWLKNQLADSNSSMLAPQNRPYRESLQTELDSLLRDNEHRWKQWAKVVRLRERDRNTRFFMPGHPVDSERISSHG